MLQGQCGSFRAALFFCKSGVSPHGGGMPRRVAFQNTGRSTRFNQQFNQTNTVSTDIHSNPPINQLPEAAREIARKAADAARETAQRATTAAKDVGGAVEDAATDAYQALSSKVEEGVERTKGYAQHAVDATRDAAHRATETAKDMYQSAALSAGDTLATSKDYVRRNPVPVVLGAIAFGAAIGYLIMSTRRKPTFSEQYVEEPLVAVREALLSALAPVSQRVHDGYESARHGVGKAMNRAHRTRSGRAVDMLSDRIGRVGSNLKFW